MSGKLLFVDDLSEIAAQVTFRVPAVRKPAEDFTQIARFGMQGTGIHRQPQDRAADIVAGPVHVIGDGPVRLVELTLETRLVPKDALLQGASGRQRHRFQGKHMESFLRFFRTGDRHQGRQDGQDEGSGLHFFLM